MPLIQQKIDPKPVTQQKNAVTEILGKHFPNIKDLNFKEVLFLNEPIQKQNFRKYCFKIYSCEKNRSWHYDLMIGKARLITKKEETVKTATGTEQREKWSVFDTVQKRGNSKE